MNLLILKLSFRQLIKTKLYSIANILGLTIGFASFILVGLFTQYEFNWDKTHENYDRIYRIQRQVTNAKYVSSGNNISPHTRAFTAQLIEKRFPEFEKTTVIRESGSTYIGTDDEHLIHEKEGIYADSCFFDIFTYHFTQGDSQTTLIHPHTIAISESSAKKLFGKINNIVGKTILLEKKYPLTVTGVYKDLPYNSSLRPPFVISFSTLKPLYNIERSSVNIGDCMTYTLLKKNTNRHDAENKIKYLFKNYKDMQYIELQLCPLSKVCLNFNDRNDYLIVLKLFGLIGVFILLMSGFNYINLSLAQTSMRNKEVAVKKVMGSRKPALVIQFLSETIIISILSLVLAFIIAELILPFFNNIVDKHIDFNVINDLKFVILMFLIAITTGILSGLYPAFFYGIE